MRRLILTNGAVLHSIEKIWLFSRIIEVEIEVETKVETKLKAHRSPRADVLVVIDTLPV
jgi:hypothetical protein